MRRPYWPMMLALLSLVLPVCLAAQSEDAPVPLGDVARALRQQKTKAKEDKEEKPEAQKIPDAAVIDNDNLSKIMEEISSHKLGKGFMFSFDKIGDTFKVSSPDVTCSLSFSAQTSALLSNPFAPRDLPQSELSKLEGPASIQGDALQVAVHNGTGWKIREITVGLTILQRANSEMALRGPAKLVAAVAKETDSSGEKHSDLTVLYHMKGTADPLSTTVFTENLDVPLGPKQEWHWAIVAAKGVAPPPAPGATVNPQP